MLKPGQEIERYTVVESIAKGGMAEVFKVRHTALDTVHALKVLVLRTEDIRRRLLQEGRMQASLRHPNAIAVTDVVDVDGHPGLVMEYVDGPTLLDWCYDERPDYAMIEAVFRDIIAGVGAAHSLKMVHRDLKPSNVLIAHQDGKWIPKVCDFGLAKALSDEQAEDATRSGVPMGTPSYMAPEQIADAKSVDPRADIFSLGALLYYMCTGRKAFDGDNAVQTYNAVLDGVYTPASHHVPNIPLHLLTTIDACLRVNPDSRPRDTDALLALLDGGTPPPDLPKPAPAPANDPRMNQLAVAIGGGVLVGALALAAMWSMRAPPQIAPPLTPVVPEHDQGEPVSPTRTERVPGRASRPPSEPKPECPTKNGLLGYLMVESKLKKGSFVTLSKDSRLTMAPGGLTNTCVLPAGTEVEVLERPEKHDHQFWLAVPQQAVTW